LIIQAQTLPLRLKLLKTKTMKKFFGVLAIAVALVACNDEASSDATADSIRVADSTRIADSTAAANVPVVAPVTDSTMKADSTMMKDSMK